jgi:histidinol-phosphate aminotransferase
MSPTPRDGLRDVPIYQPPQLDVPVRLATNECPYRLPDGFSEDLAEVVKGIRFHRYPDREATGLRQALADRHGMPVETVWAANGSNEVIEQLLLAYGGPGRTALLFEPTYALHSRLAWGTFTETTTVRLKAPFSIGPSQVRRAIESDADVIFVCSPNNPTGNTHPTDVVEKLAAETEALVVVDEAYVEFGGSSALPLVADLPNVVVVRTFSKAFALAAARIGYCFASPEVLDDVRRVRKPYHLSALAQAAGTVALYHAGEAMEILDAIRKERDRLFEALSRIEGVTAYPSDANFVLFRVPEDRLAAEVWQGLLDRGVLIRDFSPAVEGCLRVSAGTPAEVDAFLAAIEEVLSA